MTKEQTNETQTPEIDETQEIETQQEEVVVEEVAASPQASQSLIAGISEETFDALTKRNQQFMLSITNQLEESTIVDSVQQAIKDEMVQTLIEGQDEGLTARHIYGTPTEAFATIEAQQFEEEHENRRSPDWQLGIEGGLLLGSIYTVVTGVSLMNTTQENLGSQMGLVTLLLNYLVAGYAMIYISKSLPNPDAPKGERGYGKYFLVTTVAMLGWVAAIALSMALLPPSLNPVLPPAYYVGVGVLTFLLRMYLKRKWDIQGGVF